MTSRIFGSLLVSLMALMSVGCVKPADPTAVAAPIPVLVPVVSPQVQIQPLTADQLAQILGVQVWTAKYSGGPIECWLEIEEEGQSTLPKRVPETGFLGNGVTTPQEGTIDFWWTRREDGSGGMLNLRSSKASHGYGLDKDAFIFGWTGISARSTPWGVGKPIEGVPGKEFVIVDYDASDATVIKPGQTRRRIHLKLMGRFPSTR